MITVGTGIGGGIVVDGKLHRGAFGIAAEIGHMRVVPDGLLCGCGAYGCFEQYGSGNALVRFAREAALAQPSEAAGLLSLGDGTVEGISGGAITRAAESGNPLALNAFETLGNWLGAGIASLSVVLDPQCVVIGGGVIDAGDILLNPIRKGLEKYMPFAGMHPYPEIIPALLGNDAGLVGAADLARV
jgi:glucokinase